MSAEQVTDATRRETLDRETIRCVDPATGEHLGDVPVDSPEQVRAAVARAREAQALWARAPFEERRRVLRHVLEHVLEHADELCEVVVRDAGKTRENAMLGEIWPVCEKLRWTLAHGEKHLRPERAPSGMLLHKRARVEFHPRGVVGVITPWNYPLQNVLGPTIPALMAGNAVVVKVSEHTAWSAARFQRIFDEAFEACGLPTALVQILNGYGPTGAALVSSGVDLIIFTGSGGNGRKVIEQSAHTITPVILELGGKDALIVCDDADLEQAVHAAMAGVFIACGQNCMAAERILVFDGIYDRFVERVTAMVRDLRQGPPLGDGLVDVGAMTTEPQLELVSHLVDDAVRKGATVLAGGARGRGDGWFFQPTILADVTPDMLIAQEETFGPVMVLMRVRDEEEAIRVANDTQFGLGSTVLTRSRRRARRVHRRLVAGGTSVNDFGLTYMAQDLPFGGVKGSGFGRLNGKLGLRACTNQKAVLEDRLPLHAPTRLYPVGRLDYALARSTIRTLYSPRVADRASAALSLARTLRDILRAR